MCVCVTPCANDEVFWLHTPSRARPFAHVCTRWKKLRSFNNSCTRKCFEKRPVLITTCVAILLVVARAIFLTSTNLLKMRKMHATSGHSRSHYAVEYLIAFFLLNMALPLSESFEDIGNDSSLFTLKSSKFVSCCGKSFLPPVEPGCGP